MGNREAPAGRNRYALSHVVCHQSERLLGSPRFDHVRKCIVIHVLRGGSSQEVWLRVDSQIHADTAIELFWIAWPGLVERLERLDPIDGIVMPDFSI
ncbi:hypothetical protein [Tardiphaga sp.]|jgi:hypothetical protein|uniref:hypothetical protein n=1 Tax=Tardiphaga sp. TaxID=1926292 RepID=UPI0037DA6938